MANAWWEVIYTVITGGGRSAYVSGSGIKVVQAATAAAAGTAVQAEVQGAKITTVNGPYATQALAAAQQSKDTAAQAAGTEAPTGGTGTSNNPKSNLDISDPLAAIAGFFSALGNANTWIRVAKVVVGGVLLIVGLVHITGVDNAAASVARKVPLPV